MADTTFNLEVQKWTRNGMPRKNERNISERGIDFAWAVDIFLGPVIERIDTRRDYGEMRWIAMARWTASNWWSFTPGAAAGAG